MTALTIEQLETYGPDRCDLLTVDQSRAWCRRLAQKHYENFSVLSGLVPPEWRDDFASIYAFCRWADDLGDEIGDSPRSLELLQWWRRELQQCFAGQPRHPVFIALHPTITRHDLPIEPFDDLIRAFEQDQTIREYQTWDELIDYCRLSANPVGRLVLMVAGEPREPDRFSLSDDICTALQLTNHWQDVRRDMLDRDRLYIPQDMIGEMKVADFGNRLLKSARQGYGIDREFLGESRRLVRACVEKTWPLFERGEQLLDHVGDSIRPVIWLFIAGGEHVLRSIELWNYETALHRPKLGLVTRLRLVTQARWRARGSHPASASGEKR